MPTVMVVDDASLTRETLTRLLKREGYATQSASTGREALHLIEEQQPDLVLLDVMMPGKTGFEVCQAVRGDESLAGMKILMLSAKGRETDLAKGQALGADAYMTKPFSTRELADKVKALLGG